MNEAELIDLGFEVLDEIGVEGDQLWRFLEVRVVHQLQQLGGEVVPEPKQYRAGFIGISQSTHYNALQL